MNEWDQPHNNPRGPVYPPGYPHDPGQFARRKKKWVSGLLSFFIPGTGHFYLGQMFKGVAIMLFMAMDICAIVYAAMQNMNPMIIVLFSLLLPIVYFYSLFDALQSADAVNERRAYQAWGAPIYGMPSGGTVPMPEPEGVDASMPGFQPPAPVYPLKPRTVLPGNVNAPGIILIAAAAVVVLLAISSGWAHIFSRSWGAFGGAILLIGAGIGLWFWEMRGHPGRKS